MLATASADPRVVIDSVGWAFGTEAEVRADIEKLAVPPAPGEAFLEGQTKVQGLPLSVSGVLGLIEPAQLVTAVRGFVPDSSPPPAALQFLVGSQTALLRGRDRHTLVAQSPLGDLQQPAAHHLSALFRDDQLRQSVRELVSDGLGMYFVLDPTNTGQVRVRLSLVAPPSAAVERRLDQPAVEFQSRALPIETQSDGIQCFVGLIAATAGLPHQLILVDEPEAFLHPPLARRIGSALANAARQREGRVIAATHSSAFVMGALESGVDVLVVRMTYEPGRGAATVRSLRPSLLRPLTHDPLLRSSRALDGLFHRAVIVGEADADRVLYEEVNRRLVAAGRGVRDALFINAQNWQTQARIIGPLRTLGVPAAAIVDMDALAGQHAEWDRFYDAIATNASDREALEDLRLAAQAALRRRGRDYKEQGLAALTGADRKELSAAVRALAKCGIFVVPVGSLESWLPRLRVRGRKKDWVVRVLDAMGADTAEPTYVRPASGDVWKFMDLIATWVDDPERRGMP